MELNKEILYDDVYKITESEEIDSVKYIFIHAVTHGFYRADKENHKILYIAPGNFSININDCNISILLDGIYLLLVDYGYEWALSKEGFLINIEEQEEEYSEESEEIK